MTAAKRDDVLGRVQGTSDWSGFDTAEVVIEAVFEDLELKRTMVREVEERGPEGVIFASNTSSLPIGEIAKASKHPETVIGMHYFSPVHKMPMLEVITTEDTAPWSSRPALPWASGKRRPSSSSATVSASTPPASSLLISTKPPAWSAKG